MRIAFGALLTFLDLISGFFRFKPGDVGCEARVIPIQRGELVVQFLEFSIGDGFRDGRVAHSFNGKDLLIRLDRAVEIIADRGFNSLVTAAEWARVGGVMETEFRQGRWHAGALAGVAAAAKLLARHFPGAESQDNELPNRPVLL